MSGRLRHWQRRQKPGICPVITRAARSPFLWRHVMKRSSVSLLATLVAGLCFSCPAVAQKAEVIHWWTSGGESAAVKQLAEAYNKAGGQWVDNAIAGGDNARAAALNRIAGGNPPVASQFNTSKQYHELIEAGLLNNVDEV